MIKKKDDERKKNLIGCASINKAGFQKPDGKKCMKTLKTNQLKAITTMQAFDGEVISPKKAIEYISTLPNIDATLFGASKTKCP